MHNICLSGLLARLTCIRSPVTQIVEPNGTLMNEAQVLVGWATCFSPEIEPTPTNGALLLTDSSGPTSFHAIFSLVGPAEVHP